MRTGGSLPVMRPPSSSRSSRAQLSGRGVALPNTATAPSSDARLAATVRASYRGSDSCLYDGSCSSSTQISPSPRNGANIADRAPTTTRASPPAIRRRSSRRSASVRAEWSNATRAPKRSRKRPTACGVSAISGTSTIDARPRSSAAAHACRYTSVLPLPVAPKRRKLPPAPASRAPTTRSTASRWDSESRAGAGSPSSASRAPGCPRSPRGLRCTGATSASARAGVEP